MAQFQVLLYLVHFSASNIYPNLLEFSLKGLQSVYVHNNINNYYLLSPRVVCSMLADVRLDFKPKEAQEDLFLTTGNVNSAKEEHKHLATQVPTGRRVKM